MDSTHHYDFSICLCTFRRPALLDNLLKILSEHDYGGLQGELIVVDNDPQASGLPIIEQWSNNFPLPITALHVQTQNIALARNAAFNAACGNWIVIIDDDEWPDPHWFRSLLQAQKKYDADAVFGPVMPHYAEDVPSWIRDAGFFSPRQHCTGDYLKGSQTYTSNVLIRHQALENIQGPFDTKFGLTGGSDAMLFQDMSIHGARLIWSQEAVVNEVIPRSRANFSWLLRRSYSGGQIYARIETERLQGFPKLLRTVSLASSACLKLPIASWLALFFLPFSRGRSVHWLRKASAQIGQLSGLTGMRYRAYDLRTKHRAN